MTGRAVVPDGSRAVTGPETVPPTVPNLPIGSMSVAGLEGGTYASLSFQVFLGPPRVQ